MPDGTRSSEENLFAPIALIAARYRDGSLSPMTVTEQTLARIERLNPTLNAFITVTQEAALDAARRSAVELASGNDRGLLHGIPIALKDLVDTRGIRTTCGSRILADHVPDRSATVARLLQAAGAVCVGKTNLLEFAYGIVHPDVGATWNPWDPTRTAGGSSGGSAAAVAAGLCFAAVGTDTGGSIRIPASYCGVAGLKPTYGLVDLDGIFPLSWSLDHAGPIARNCVDAALMLDGMLGRPPQCIAAADLHGLRLGVLTAHCEGWDMEPAVADLFDAACGELVHAGARLHAVSIASLAMAGELMFPIIGPEASVIHRQWLDARPQDYALLTRKQLEAGTKIPAVDHVHAQRARRQLIAEFNQALTEVDVILSPTSPWVAPHADPPPGAPEGEAEGRRTGPGNLTGLPALTVNMGFTPAGLPAGLQITGRAGADAMVLAIGAAFEALYAQQRRPAWA